MPTTVTDLPAQLDPPRKLWTRSEYEEISSGVIDGERLELIEGELINKMGKKPPHRNSVCSPSGMVFQRIRSALGITGGTD